MRGENATLAIHHTSLVHRDANSRPCRAALSARFGMRQRASRFAHGALPAGGFVRRRPTGSAVRAGAGAEAVAESVRPRDGHNLTLAITLSTQSSCATGQLINVAISEMHAGVRGSQRHIGPCRIHAQSGTRLDSSNRKSFAATCPPKAARKPCTIVKT